MSKKRTDANPKKKAPAKKAGGGINFTLRNVNTEKLDQTYGLDPLEQSKNKTPEHSTKLVDLSSRKHETVSYLNDAKKTKTGILFSVDINNNTYGPHYYCFWDHHPLGPANRISCPVEYIFSQAVRSYFSEVSKNKYTIRENLTNKSALKLRPHRLSEKAAGVLRKLVECNDAKNNFDVMDLLANDFYLTDAVFCSYNCCLAFILENFRNPLYKESEQLLYKMYYDAFGISEKITPSNHYRTLAVYGGKVSIGKFRQNLESIEYSPQGLIKMRPIAHLYEEKYKL